MAEIIALVAMVGVSFIACDDDNNGNNDVKVGKTPFLIDVTSQPTKTEYNIGDNLDLTGLEVTAYYDDGSSTTVATFITDPAEGTTLNESGLKEVTVNYTEGEVTLTTKFTVGVIPDIEDITINSFDGTWSGSTILGEYQEAVISNITDYGAMLVYSFRGLNNDYSVTLNFIWGEKVIFTDDRGSWEGFVITGTLSNPTGTVWLRDFSFSYYGDLLEGHPTRIGTVGGELKIRNSNYTALVISQEIDGYYSRKTINFYSKNMEGEWRYSPSSDDLQMGKVY